MDAATLKRVQPADGTTAALRASLSLLAAEHVATSSRLTCAHLQRRQALTGGTSKQVAAAEDDVRDAEISLQQIAAIRAEVEARLPAAKGHELIAHLRTLQGRAEVAVQTFREAWPEYRGFAERVAAILRVEQEASARITELQNALHSVGRIPEVIDTGKLGTIVVPQLPGVPIAWGVGRSTAANAVKLPAAAEGEPAVWWTRT